MSTSSYPAEYFVLFQHVSQQGELPIPCASPQDAIRLRARLHALRREMRDEQHPFLPFAEDCEFVLRESVLIARPKDRALISALHAAGIKPPEVNVSIPERLPIIAADEPDPAIQALRILRGAHPQDLEENDIRNQQETDSQETNPDV